MLALLLLNAGWRKDRQTDRQITSLVCMRRGLINPYRAVIDINLLCDLYFNSQILVTVNCV